MKRYVVKSSRKASKVLSSVKITATHENEAIFSPQNITELLSQLPEMQGANIGYDTAPDGTQQLFIDDRAYNLLWS